MKKEYYVCDRCERVISEDKNDVAQFMLFNERRMSAAGDSDNWYWAADLCVSCTRIALIEVMKLLEESVSFEKRKAFAAKFKAKEV